MRLHFEDGERELVRTRLQLADDADDAAIATAVANWIQEDPTANNTSDDDANGDVNAQNNTEGLPDQDGDFVVVDVSEFARLRSRDRVAGQIEAANAIRDRDELIEEAISDGKFAPARRDHYRTRYDSDPEGTKALLARLTPHTVPLEARGANAPTDEEDQDSYDRGWVPEVAARQERTSGDGGRRNRVHGEN